MGLRTAFLAARRWVLLWSFCLIVPTAAQQLGQENRTTSFPQPILKVSAVVVNLYATIRDKRGRLISSLHQEDFNLTEDSVPQQICYFSHEADSPLTLGIMIDTSPSQGQLLAAEQKQAQAFIARVLRAKDLAFVLRFDVDVELLQDLTSSQRLLESAIGQAVTNREGRGLLPESMRPASADGTHLYDAIYLASNELMKSNVGRKVLIVLTDGEDRGSKVTPTEALEAAEKADVIIYSVAIADDQYYWALGMTFRGLPVLRRLSQATGGQMVRVNRAGGTAAAFAEIAGELRAQYFLGYSPTNKLCDGSFRKIGVAVRKRNYRVRVRRGYFAQSK